MFLFDDSHFDRCEVIAHCGFDLHFLLNSDAEHLFKCLVIHMFSLKNTYLDAVHFLVRLALLFDTELYEFLKNIYFGY